jgi:ComF family protein
MTPREVGAALARGFLDLLFAPVCLGCESPIAPASPSPMVCRVCWSRMRDIPLPRCDRCWTPRPSTPPTVAPLESCSTCDALPPSLRAVRSAFVMEGPARQLVHALKYGGWHALAPGLAERMAALPLPREVREEVRCVVPVPLSRVRLRARGYNQAALLAGSVARFQGWRDGSGILERTRATDSQTALHPAERLANVAGAFRVRAERRSELRREHVLVVDDVWTTGATALACADALISAGARAVSVLTFARALPDLRL